MEIERKFLVSRLPEDLESYPHNEISQAYISTEPVIRIRRKNDTYILTVKSKGLLKREEFEMNISKKEYDTLLKKSEGNLITKTRYKIPDRDGLTIELDIFHGLFDGLIFAEVEFPDESTAAGYIPPDYFGREVTEDPSYQNSSLSMMNPEDIRAFINMISVRPE